MVGNLNVCRPRIGPNKANPKLIVDADTVLSRSITYQSFEAITRRRFQVLKHCRGLQHRKLAGGDFSYGTETPRLLRLEKLFGVLAFESLNCHMCILYRFPVSSKKSGLIDRLEPPGGRPLWPRLVEHLEFDATETVAIHSFSNKAGDPVRIAAPRGFKEKE
jgi:hypothetical protein